MTREWPLSLRLTIWYLFAVALGLAIFSTAVWLSMRHSLMVDLDSGLRRDAESLQRFVDTESQDPAVHLSEELDEYSRAFPRGTFLEITSARGQVLFASDRHFPFGITAPGEDEVSSAAWLGHNYRVLRKQATMAGKPAQVVLSSSMDSIEDILSRLRFLLLAFVPAVIVLAASGGAWLSRRALRPLDKLVIAAQSISINNLSERLAVPQTGDELQRLSETWNAMLSRLEAAVTRLSRFTADASHELRTPLAIIRASAEIASRKSRSAESYRAALNQIVLDSERMTSLVEDLLLLARCDSEAADMPMGVFDVAETVRDICAQAQPWAGTKRLTLATNIDPDPIFLEGSEPAIRRLVFALLTNAIQYSPAGELVLLQLHAGNEHATLEVCDHGHGIPDPQRELIFQRFYRAADARAAAPGGSGLGLALASSIAQRHGARIDVVSTVGEGSTFRVVFPLIKNHSTALLNSPSLGSAIESR